MHTITRNNTQNKKGKHLLTFLNGALVLSIKNTKLLCGYSENSGNDVILDKISKKNTISELTFTKKGLPVENFYVTLGGFKELSENLTQKDKIQNARLALRMMIEASDEVKNYYKQSEETKNTLTKEQIVEEIRSIVDAHGFNKADWIKLYDEFSIQAKLNYSIVTAAQRNLGKYPTLKYEVLNFIASTHPDSLTLLHDIALKMYN